MEQSAQRQPWHAHAESPVPSLSPRRVTEPSRTTPADRDLRSPASSTHRQIIGNYELGRVLATGDFDCRTRLCAHVTTGVPYVVRIYEKRVLAEAQWMWDRIAESIHVQRKLPRDKHVLEMVECFESNTSVYILMHLFPSMNLTKLFTDAAARAELLTRLHAMSRVAVRSVSRAPDKAVSPADGHDTSGGGDGGARGGRGGQAAVQSSSSTPLSSATRGQLPLRPSFRQAMNSSHSGGSRLSGSTSEMSEHADASQRSPRAHHTGGGGEARRGSAAIFHNEAGASSVAVSAAIHGLSVATPPHIPFVLIRVLFQQAVEGVLFLHQNGVAHTGIAPDHLLVSPAGLLRIGNMVSTCFCAPGERQHELRGTMHTVAPEVLRGEAYDPFLADAWALGVVLYFMLNRGRYPHDGANTLRHILHGHTRPSRPGVPAVALDLLSRLMQAKAEDRLPVDAVLAHPFFTAALPTVEEELAAEEAAAAAAAAAALNGRHSGFSSVGAAGRGGGERTTIATQISVPGLGASTSQDLDLSSNTATARSSSDSGFGNRGGGGRSGALQDSTDLDVSRSFWSSPPLHFRRHRHPSLFSSTSDVTGAVVPAEMSSIYDHQGTTTTATNTTHSSLMETAVMEAEERSGVLSPRYRPTFPHHHHHQHHHTHHHRQPHDVSTLPRPLSMAATGGDAVAELHSRILSPRSPARNQAAVNAKPLWRPELAASVEELEDLAARVIQHFYRAATHRRRYKAETHALMKRGQSMYLGSGSGSSSRDRHSGGTTHSDSGRERASQHTAGSRSQSSLRRPPSFTTRVPALVSERDGGRAALSHSAAPTPKGGLQRRALTAAAKSPASSGATPSVWKRRLSQLSQLVAGGGNAAAASPTKFGRWPSSVGFGRSPTHSAGKGAAGGGASVHGRSASSTVTIDTRAVSVVNTELNSEGDDDDFGDLEDSCGLRAADGAAALHDRPSGFAATSTTKASRVGSLTLPTLPAAAGVVPTLLSQQGRRRSTFSAVLSTVPSGRAAGDRHRSTFSSCVNGGVSDSEVCPLCHREPYAIRSIAIRPYGATPFQFVGGEFQKLPQ